MDNIPVEPFYGRNASAVNKLNQMREKVNRNTAIMGDGFILSHLSQLGATSHLSIEQLIARIRGRGGTTDRIAYVAEDATDANTITCFLDYDGTDPSAWALQEWTVGDTLTGTDSKIYRCLETYTASDTTTRPITGTEALYQAKWAEIEQIEVECNICGGGNLSDASPHLLTMHKSVGYDGTTPAAWVVTTAYTTGDYIIGTNSKEIYVCIDNHTSTANDRPSSGDDWETYWEVAKRYADELIVVEIDSVWKSLGLFQASYESASMAP